MPSGVCNDYKLHAQRLFEFSVTINFMQDAFLSPQRRKATNSKIEGVHNDVRLATQTSRTAANDIKLG